MDGKMPYNESNAAACDTSERAKGPPQVQAPDAPHGDALKSDDVIELQAFLERRTWIENKIQLFENMAVIDVYAGSESLVTSSGRVTGLPTREQLDVWTREWENIESETEQFDQGDMIRLKDFAKAKSEQNLSPQDTDLIEVTLTTLLAVDKLLHLLRSRSETLDMLGLRLQWEDQRIAAWDTRSQLLDELKAFSEHALWEASVYAPLSAPAPSTSTSRHSTETVQSPESMFPHVLSMFARSARRKLAEGLVAEARGLTSRMTYYKRDILPRPGATLDKMIETSSTKVPDLILDEQDRLENDSKIFDGLDKFIPAVQMQWKKADEFYAELMKDQATAHILLDEIAKARAQHPTSALDQSFTSRSTSLSSRLSAIGHPSTIIPRPRHPLVPDQVTANEKIHEVLSSELAIAIKLSRKGQLKVKEYHTTTHAVERVTSLSIEAAELSLRLERFSDRLKNGSVVPDGNGTPPDLADDRCLHPTQHGSYIALLPSLLKEIDLTDAKARKNVADLRSVLLELRGTTLQPSFPEDALRMAEKLSAQLIEVEEAKKSAMQNVDVLRRARGIWTRTTDVTSLISAVRADIMNALESQQWTATLGHDGAPLTPDSPGTNSEATIAVITPEDATSSIASIESVLSSEVQELIAQLSHGLPPVLLHRLQTDSHNASTQIEDLRDLVRVWRLARGQSDAMRLVLAETYELEGKVDSLREEIQQSIDQTLRKLSWNNDPTVGDAFTSRVGDLRIQETKFLASMISRIPFISSTVPALLHQRSLSVSSISPNVPQAIIARSHSLEAFQRKLTALDQVVRNDANALAMSLGASMDALRRKLDLFSLAELARLLDNQVSNASRALQTATEHLGEKMSLCDYLLSTIEKTSSTESQSQEQMDLDQQFAQLLTDVDQTSTEHSRILSQAIDTAQGTLRLMRSSPGAHDASVHDDMLNRRSRIFEDIEARVQAFQRDVASLRTKLVEGRRQAEQRAHERTLLEEREEMLRRGSLSKAELEASQRALQESELKAQAAIEEHRRQWEAEHLASSENGDDVFGNLESDPSGSKHRLRAQIAAIRIELRSIGINSTARPVSDVPDSSLQPTLPTLPQAQTMRGRLNVVVAAFGKLPSHVSDSTLLGELQSLKFEIDASHPALARVEHLAMFASGVDHCDAALSDLLEHLDTFPSLPIETASPHIPDPNQAPIEQLKSRLAFCQGVMSNLHAGFDIISDDERVKDEKIRLEQTWAELTDMAKDRTRPITRPTSPISVRSTMIDSTNTASSSSAATRPSRSSVRPPPPPRTERSRLRTTTSLTSQSPLNKQFFTGPRQPSSRPPIMTHSRNSSRMSNRSVSGPSTTTSSTLYSSTFSSRQRTNSVASASTPPMPTTPGPVLRPRLSNNPTPSAPSPSPSISKSKPPTIRPPPRPPRASLPNSGAATPHSRRSISVASDRPKVPRRSYVANPKNKLDVAVGAVVNKLPADVHIEAIPTAWQDESGKYWIGDSDPKLCFCRILRSQTVMVRVGGGWVELSKFIRDHFAHLFRIDPTTPPKTLGRPSEEKWISSATLLESSSQRSPSVQDVRPTTPLVRMPLLVSASGSSQGRGLSPPGIPLMHHSPGSSPLTPMHFIRRASVEPPYVGPTAPSSKPHNPPATPAMMKTSSSATHLMTPTPSRPPVWR